MAHIKTETLGLWKPQDLGLDKINSQMMFIDNINTLDEFAKSISGDVNQSMQSIHAPVNTLTELRAINTSDTVRFKTGMLIMVRDNGIYSFNRNSTLDDDNNAVVAPTTGGGRWITTQITDIVLNPIEVQDNSTLDARLESILTNMSNHSMKFFIIRALSVFAPFEGGTIHMTMYKVSNLYASIMCTVYNTDRVARVYTSARYDGIWGRWVMLPFLDANGKIPLDQLPSGVLSASVE